jgi:predicted transcriptional regulator of viral defense system
MKADRHLRDIAVRQGGVILRSQAIDLGLDDQQIRYRREDGDWHDAGRGAYRLIEMPDHLDKVRAAIAVLPDCVASHETAAELNSIPRVRRGIAVVSVHTRTTHEFPGVIVRRMHDLVGAHIATIGGIPTTTVARTVVDLATRLSRAHVTDIVEDLFAAGRLDGGDLASTVRDVARRGRPGSTVLREVVAEYVDGEAIQQSVMERRGRRLLSDAGLPSPLHEYPVPWSRARRFDDAYPDHRIAIEWDGRRWHMRHDAFDADRHRDNEAHRHDWHVYRFTWRDVEVRPHYVIDTIRRALGRTVG